MIFNLKIIYFIVFLIITSSYNAYAENELIIPANDYAAELLEDRYLDEHNDIGKDNLVDSKEMALELAEFYIKNYYGEKVANLEKPYLIADNKTEWIVTGQLPPMYVGGTFLIVISKADGKVIGLMHDR